MGVIKLEGVDNGILLKEMPEKNVVTWTVVIVSLD